ncbi:hypothetical protein [Micromonospora cathayae]|uniref:SdpI/YhfL protein family protein n=1 Tax=Micromonospora cathayae TaxID=3028804 RepID=A0ABY7ZN21_9ACTN|nr:hypothetical protein [Micromonospora sp. HUAS 3]WDZ84396.1 hypothetical protein PVK37_28800 [Micromonospora sp. HUAS 3]
MAAATTWTVFQFASGRQPNVDMSDVRGRGTPRWVYWWLLVSTLCTFTSQVLSGFDRPLEIIVGVLSGCMAIFCGITLVVRRKA